METLCPACEKKLLVRLHPEPHCATWCGNCMQEIPEETLLEAGLPPSLLAQIRPWADRARELLEVDDEGVVGGDHTDGEYLTAWKTLRDATEELLLRLRTVVPAGTAVFGAPKPPQWSDEEIIRWRRQREREGLLFSYGYQQGARFVEEGGLPLTAEEPLPVDYPSACVTPSEKTRWASGFTLGTQAGTYDPDLHREIETKIRRRK